jgi:hypothetical protein
VIIVVDPPYDFMIVCACDNLDSPCDLKIVYDFIKESKSKCNLEVEILGF